LKVKNNINFKIANIKAVKSQVENRILEILKIYKFKKLTQPNLQIY